MHLYHKVSRNTQTGDFGLCISCLSKRTRLFFELNHVNYERWSTVYYGNLLKVTTSYPDVYRDFVEEYFAIQRTGKPFSATSIDLTLEQTINADASKQHTGILPFTNSLSTR